MYFAQLNEGACKTYLIASQGQAMLVDPVLEGVEGYLEEVRRLGCELRLVIDTHVHADHISGGPTLTDHGAVYIMHEISASACAHRRVVDGDMLRLGEVEIRVMHTPGHTQDSITLVFPDRILTGDFLFLGEGGAGRTDLPGGDAGEHWDSLQKLRDLPDDMLVYPAHEYHGRDHSTLGDERRDNPRLVARSRSEYIGWLNSQRLGPAEWMADVIRANYACARDPRAAWIPVDQPTCEVGGTRGNVNTELVETIEVSEVERARQSARPPLILDVRRPEEYQEEHIPGAQLIPVGDLPRRLDELSGSEARPIVTVCRTGGRSSTAAAILKMAGFSTVHSLDGGMKRWVEQGLPVERA